MEGKRFIQIFTTTNSYIDDFRTLTVYSYLAYKAAYDMTPNITAIAAYTGIDRETVSHSLVKLKSMGLIDPDGSVAPPSPNCGFVKLQVPEAEAHWRSHWGYWKLYIRNQESPLTFLGAAYWSWRYHAWNTKFPKHKLKNNYIATILRCDRHAFTDIQASLEKAGIQSGNFSELSPATLANFAESKDADDWGSQIMEWGSGQERNTKTQLKEKTKSPIYNEKEIVDSFMSQHSGLLLSEAEQVATMLSQDESWEQFGYKLLRDIDELKIPKQKNRALPWIIEEFNRWSRTCKKIS